MMMKHSTADVESGADGCVLSEDQLALIDAVKNDQESKVRALTDAGVDGNITDESGKTVLSYAVTNGNKCIIDILIDAGVDVNVIDNSGKTALVYAAIKGDESVVHTLIDAGADVNKIDKNSPGTALFYVALNNRYSVVCALINAGADVNMIDAWGQTPLFYAVNNNNENMVHTLIDAGADINITNKHSKTALFNAVMDEHENLVHALIEAGVDVNITDKEQGRTDLFTAVKYAKICMDEFDGTDTEADITDDAIKDMYLLNERLAHALIDAGTDVNIADKCGQTVLFDAVKNDNERLAHALIVAGADVNIADKCGQTVLFDAVKNDNEKLAHVLIDAGADINIADKYGETVLFDAVEKNYESLAHALIDAGADANICSDLFGRSVLFRAVFNENESMACTLIDAGADVNITDSFGQTALFYAVKNENESMIHALIADGANVNITDKEGKTSLFFAVENDDNEDQFGFLTFFNENILHTLIKDCNSSVKTRDIYGRTPLFYAITKSPRAARYLLKNGGNLNLKDHCNTSILSFFVEQCIANHRYVPVSTSISPKSEAVNLLKEQGVKDKGLAKAIINLVFCVILLALYRVIERMSPYEVHVSHLNINRINKTSISHALTVALNSFDETETQKKNIIKNILEVLRKANTSDNVSKVLALLVELGAKPNSADSHGNTALHYATLLSFYGASQAKVMDICCQLERFGVTFNIKNQENENPLLFCLSRCYRLKHESNNLGSVMKTVVEVCRCLLKHGSSVNDTSKSGESVFHWMIKLFQEYIDFLHDKAAIRQNVLQELMELLQLFSLANIKKGVIVNKSDDTLNSPLHLWASLVLMSDDDYNIDVTRDCVFEEFIKEILKYLLECGAKLNLRNVHEQTPLHLCRTWSAVKLLLDAGANPNDVDSSGNTTLLVAAKNKIFLKNPDCFYPDVKEDPIAFWQTTIKNDVDSSGNTTVLVAAKNKIFLKNPDCFYPDVKEDPIAFWQTTIKKRLDPLTVNEHGESVLSILIELETFVLSKALIDVTCKEENYMKSDGTVAVSLLNAVCKDKSTRTHWKTILVETILKSIKGQASLDGPLRLCCRNIIEFGLSDDKKSKNVKPQIKSRKGFMSEDHGSGDDEEQPRSKKSRKEEPATSTEETRAEFKNKPAKYDSVHYEIAKRLINYGADYRSPDSSGKSCLDISEACHELKDFLMKPIDIDEIPIVIPWTSDSKNFKSKLAKVARRQEYKLVDTLWYHTDCIGSGSFGHVFAGINENDGREVAIKRIEKLRMQRPEDKREIKNLTALADYKNVVRYQSFFEDENFSYVVLELMEGDLDSYFEDPVCHPRENVQRCNDILMGLKNLHGQNIIHRDLKPSNILYKTHPERCLKIADFGLSRRIDSTSTTVYGTNVGTRCWIAPEVLKSTKDHSISSDIFSCGLVLHYILSVKKHPFSPANCVKKSDLEINNEREANVIHDKMEGWDNSLSPEATHLVKRMLESDESRRPTAAEALNHPLFWPKKEKMDLLTAVGNQPEFGRPRAKRTLPLTAVETELEKSFSTVIKHVTWIDTGYINMPCIYTEMTAKKGSRKSYDTRSLVELVRFIRNTHAHVSEHARPTAIRKQILEDFVFLDYFPSLVIEVFKSVTAHGWDHTRDEIKYTMNK